VIAPRTSIQPPLSALTLAKSLATRSLQNFLIPPHSHIQI